MSLSAMEHLLEIMVRLRDPERGCPWDREQTFASIAPHTLEEAYEVVDAIDRGDARDLQDELGDLLFQVVYHARMAEEQGLFCFEDVAQSIADKLIRRHPNVFGQEARPGGASEHKEAWERHKAAERSARAQATGQVASVLEGIAPALPALSRAYKLGQRVAPVGFDWPTPARVLEKLDEEVRELQDELSAGGDPDLVAGELGDMLFVVAQLSRKLGIDPEGALRKSNAKFERRFHHVEAGLAARGSSPAQASLEDMEDLWRDAKRLERQKTDVA